MNSFDEKLKERARQEPFPLPEDYAGRVFRTCAALEETNMETKMSKKHSYRWIGWVAAVLAVFIAIPNVSPTAAAALREVPVLGTIVEIITFRDYTYNDGQSTADVKVPELGGSDAADQVNDQIQAYTDQLIAQFQKDCETIGEGYQDLDVTSSVVTDTDTWFTLRIDATKTMASGYSFSKFYHINKATGETVTLGDLFQDDADYASVLTAEVKRQMEEQMAADESVIYFPEQLTTMDSNQNFYWNENGDLVLIFDEYTVAPGYMGMVEFTISKDVYQDLLK